MKLKRRRRGRGGGSGNTPIWVTSYVHIYEQLLRPIPPLWWQLRHYWDKYIFKFREIHHEILTNIFYKFYKYWSKSWKLHQFHPDGDSWDIIGNILGHLLNLSPTVSRYMTQGKTSGSTIFENLTPKMKIWRRRFFLHFCACVRVCNWTIHLSSQLCYLRCISCITYFFCSERTNHCNFPSYP